MTQAGIDYGNGLTNIDQTTGIRFGVVSHHVIGEAWYESSEADYGEPTCGHCGNPAIASSDADEATSEADWFDGKDYACVACQRCFWSDDAFGDEAVAHTFEDDDYKATQGSDGDIFILRSPYYTLCSFCSPCAPGAGYLTDQTPNGIKAYCFGPDWFENSEAPYAVYRVSDDTLVCAAKAGS